MGKINGCLKCLFIFFNVIFAILGCVLIYSAVKMTAYSNQLSAVGSPSSVWMWLFAIGVFGISCLGIFAACSEKALALKIFAGFMVVGMIVMLIFGIICVVMRNKIRDVFTSSSAELFQPYLKEPEIRHLLDEFQLNAQCCGLTGVSDWGEDIPDSCQCRSSLYEYGRCIDRPDGTTGPDRIINQPCGKYILDITDLVFNVTIGLFFGFAVTALLGLLVSLLMIHQVKRHDHPGAASIAMKGY
ncbi:23 kDa integral membrane protein-like [Cynoglossus semilaevis]|uniref:Tetraspanin n=1 Tax=Cynoglossus semilaevis TaxID=244447 RepID=A0A3P8UTT2_CYNSE|nr:23 kDa integral membrane protein-like [Cynoglossus semilaevis]